MLMFVKVSSLGFCRERALFLLSLNLRPPPALNTKPGTVVTETANSYTALTTSRHWLSAVQKLIIVTYSVLTQACEVEHLQSPLDRGRNRGTERSHNTPKATEIVNGRVGIRTQIRNTCRKKKHTHTQKPTRSCPEPTGHSVLTPSCRTWAQSWAQLPGQDHEPVRGRGSERTDQGGWGGPCPSP